jgi:glycosyltransferase involved in cell wall biosynthesis
VKVSLILATVGRTTEVGRCLRSLATQTDRNFEVLLVDQNLDERLTPFIQEANTLGLDLTHLRMSVPSLAGARNLGLSKASGDIIGLTDDDCWYDQEAIGVICNAFQSNPQLDGAVAQWVEQSAARIGGPACGPLALAAWRRYRGGDASSITLFFKRSLFTRLGGFDVRFGIGQWFGAAEEIDFVLRALGGGAQLAHCPMAKVHHHFGGGHNGPVLVAAQNARKRSRGTGGIYAKHHLSAWTVLRGFSAPLLLPLLRGKLRAAAIGAFVSLGRLEGFLRWKLKGLA